MREQISATGYVRTYIAAHDKPWRMAGDTEAVVVPSGQGRTLRGQFVQAMRRDEAYGTPLVVALREYLGTRPVKPSSPGYIKYTPRSTASHAGPELRLFLATAYGDYNPRLKDVGIALGAVLRRAVKEDLTGLIVPLIGSGRAGLDQDRVARALMDAVHDFALDTSRSALRTPLSVVFVVKQQQLSAVRLALSAASKTRWPQRHLFEPLAAEAGAQDIRVIETLMGGYSSASLYICEFTMGEGTHARKLPAEVVKIGSLAAMQAEHDRILAAKRHLPSMIPSPGDAVLELPERMGAILMPLLASPDQARSLMRFGQLCGDAGEMHQVTHQSLDKMRGIYREGEIRQQEDASSLLKWMEEQRNQQYASEAVVGAAALNEMSVSEFQERRALLMPALTGGAVPNPFWRLHERLRKIRFDLAESALLHGDLNPRNILVIQNSHGALETKLIDFARFGGPGPLVADFARLEAGILMRVLGPLLELRDIESEAHWGEDDRAASIDALLGTLYGQRDVTLEAGETFVGRVHPLFVPSLHAVSAIRQVCSTTRGKDEIDGGQYYSMVCLCLLGYLRPFYEQILTSNQRDFALCLAGHALATAAADQG